MRALLRVVAIATILAWSGTSMNSAAAQDFNDRWSIIPQAHAEPAPEAPDQTKQNSPADIHTGDEPGQPEAPRHRAEEVTGRDEE